ncbi:MAG TPA: galactosyldiacylglycerol synthase [Anaerolineae bacterium]|nr:galactosyldiacylglycerol synthase [Anaerolineae bacterium]
MVNLFDAASGARIGRITEAQLQALVGWMEEESTEDRDYYVSADALDLMEQGGIDPTLVAVLRQALGDRDDMDIRYEVEQP